MFPVEGKVGSTEALFPPNNAAREEKPARFRIVFLRRDDKLLGTDGKRGRRRSRNSDNDAQRSILSRMDPGTGKSSALRSFLFSARQRGRDRKIRDVSVPPAGELRCFSSLFRRVTKLRSRESRDSNLTMM